MTGTSSTSVRIRPLTKASCGDAARLINHMNGMRRLTADFVAIYCLGARRTARVYLAHRGNQAIGLALTADTPNFNYGHVECTLHYLFVMPRFRGGGIGKRLTAHAASDALARGCTWYRLSTAPDNVKAQKLYEEMGFEKRDFRPVLFMMEGRPFHSLAKTST